VFFVYNVNGMQCGFGHNKLSLYEQFKISFLCACSAEVSKPYSFRTA